MNVYIFIYICINVYLYACIHCHVYVDVRIYVFKHIHGMHTFLHNVQLNLIFKHFNLVFCDF